jgi:hypothetical protein
MLDLALGHIAFFKLIVVHALGTQLRGVRLDFRLGLRLLALSETLPFSCPFGAPKTGKRQQAPAQSEGQKSSDSRSDRAGSGNVQHKAAKGGYRFFFRLLSGGL